MPRKKSNPLVQTLWEAEGVSKSTYYRRKKNPPVAVKPEAVTDKVSQPKKSQSHTVSCKDETEKPAEKRSNEATRFKPGNPGKPKGTRHKLTQRFVEAMCADFEENGIEVIRAVRTTKPEAYLAAMVRLVPQQVEHGEVGAFDNLSDMELDAFIVANAKQYIENRNYH